MASTVLTSLSIVCRTYSPFIRSHASKPEHAANQYGERVVGVAAGQRIISQTSARTCRV
jgi:hypothetical protein